MMKFRETTISIRGESVRIREMPALSVKQIEQSDHHVERSLRIAAACLIDDNGLPIYTYESLKEKNPPVSWLTEVVKEVGLLNDKHEDNEGN
jgi:hypothetical protein